ncbi:MAG: peptidylprolyl isomerase [Calditrichaeota bacterium]|nr:MAG: peptidylprolyl isomerase [Calditrichota bacterium]MBL1203821.1 peptidylprolyl isomerase [Calditrichota bacterium]NOG43652.1 peptidylprolyl isomerase [Calditrichota bacterium]
MSDDKLLFLASKLNGIKARFITDYGNIEVKFFPESAPIQCFNFITRAESGYYDNTLFHRVMAGFMIQGGDPHTKTSNKALYGSGGPIANIPHEFNERTHKRGILSTARTPNINAGAGSQFFIMHGDRQGLDKQYTVFGEVTKGMDVVDKIASLETQGQMAINPAKIKTIEVYR